MRRLLPCLMLAAAVAAIAALPATAGAKGGIPGHEPTSVTWLTMPDGEAPGGPGWLARVRILGDVAVHPQFVVRDEVTGKEERRTAVPYGEGIWATRVPFPRPGLYTVWLANYDPQDPWRIHDIGPSVRIEGSAVAAGATGDGGSFPWWPVLPVALLAVVGVALATRMVRPRLDHGLS